MTLQEFIDRAAEQFGSPLNVEVVVESMLPQVFQETALRLPGSVRKKTKTVTFTNGAATLSADVLTTEAHDSYLYDPDDSTKEYSLVPEFADFTRVYDDRIGYYCITAGLAIMVIEPGEVYDDGAGISDTRSLNIPCVPEIPATAATAIDAPNEFVNAALDALVERLRGAK